MALALSFKIIPVLLIAVSLQANLTSGCSKKKLRENLQTANEEDCQKKWSYRDRRDLHVDRTRARRENPFLMIGGEPVRDINRWPWAVSLKKDGDLICGGVIISKTWIATAAHCVEVDEISKYKVRVGDEDLSWWLGNYWNQYSVAKIIVHPYYRGSMYHDIALLQLKQTPSRYSDVRPVCMHTWRDEIDRFATCYVVGWGKSEKSSFEETLQELSVSLMSNYDCRSEWGWFGMLYITDQFICTGTQPGSSGACNGDSGGPLFCRWDNYWYLAGIVNSVSAEGCTLKPDIHIRESSFFKWINDTVNRNGGPDKTG